ncbi:MAG: hypothetical protein IIA67_08815, partial [Planctomycetes bacterium]|nr:hypothetical protein [Planctomycetota bacterium]
SEIDFRYLAGKKVYLDTTYLKLNPEGKSAEFVRTNYIISSLRQQMFAANVRLQDTKDKADLIVEARVGGLGADGSVVTYGIPASNALRSAASLLPNTPVIPTIPEIAFAKKDESSALAKFSLFAYERVSKKPVWQSGISVSKSTSKDVWIFGAGPFQSGTIHEGTKFAGSRIGFSRTEDEKDHDRPVRVAYDSPFVFEHEIKPLPEPSSVTLASGTSQAEKQGKKVAAQARTKRKPSVAKPRRLPLPKRRSHPLLPLTPSSRKRTRAAGR